MKVRPRELNENTRCPYCHDTLGKSGLVRCGTCRAHYHVECVESCVSLGCGGILATVKEPAASWVVKLQLLVVGIILGAIGLALGSGETGGETWSGFSFFLGLTLMTAGLGSLLFYVLWALGRSSFRHMYDNNRGSTSRNPIGLDREPDASARLARSVGAELGAAVALNELAPEGEAPSGLRAPRPPQSAEGSSSELDVDDARLRQIETLRHRRRKPGLGKTI